MGAELSSVNCIPIIAFDLSTLTGSFQSLNGAGNADDIKQMTIFNGYTAGVDISYDGVNQHDYWPPGATIVLDFQANHADNSAYGSGTKYLRKGQIIWGRTGTNPTFLKVAGYR